MHLSKILGIVEANKNKNFDPIGCARTIPWVLMFPNPNPFLDKRSRNLVIFHSMAPSMIYDTCVAWLHTLRGKKEREGG